MGAELLRMNADNPNPQDIADVAKAMREGAVIIYPTDTVYGLGCDFSVQKAVERVARIKGLKPNKANLALIFYDLSDLSQYTRPLPNSTFRMLKKALPGPYTFILPANNNLPSLFKKKSEIGIRVPDHAVPRELVRVLGNPMITTSIHDEDHIIEYTSDPSEIFDNFQDKVDIIIDGGYGNNIPSTIVDARSEDPAIMREGLGDASIIL